jgi:hypothetical protein
MRIAFVVGGGVDRMASATCAAPRLRVSRRSQARPSERALPPPAIRVGASGGTTQYALL